MYGFDYDYTLACYKKSLHYLLYDLARNVLIDKYKVKPKNEKKNCLINRIEKKERRIHGAIEFYGIAVSGCD